MRKPKGLELREGRARAAALRDAKVSPLERIRAEGAFARRYIDPGLLRNEPELQASCWIAYRFLTAFACTELFTVTYDQKVRRFLERYVDAGSAVAARPLRVEFAANSDQVMSQLWRARQAADDIGMPYDLFIEFAFDRALIDKGHKRGPRPNQLYSPNVLIDIAKAWDERMPTVALFAPDWDERFFAERFNGSPAQVAALDYLEARIRSKPANMELALRSRLGMFGPAAITIAEAVRRFGFELVEQALGRSPLPSELTASPSKGPAPPSCVGWLTEPASQRCTTCPVLKACHKAAAQISERVVRDYGTADPRGDHCRAVDRARQQRYRAKKRAGMGISSAGLN